VRKLHMNGSKSQWRGLFLALRFKSCREARNVLFASLLLSM
jgi:hypothetical protein